METINLMEDIVFCGLNLGAWVTIVTVLAMFLTLSFTKLREDVAFLGTIGKVHDAQFLALAVCQLDLDRYAAALCRLNFFSILNDADVEQTDVFRRTFFQSKCVLGLCDVLIVNGRCGTIIL